MPRKETKPKPETACRFHGGPWDGKLKIMAVGLPRIEVPSDGDNPPSGHYLLGAKLRELRRKNAIEYAYEWVPEEATTEGVARHK